MQQLREKGLQAGSAQHSSRTAHSVQSLESSSRQPALEAAHASAACSISQRAIEHMQAVKVGPCLCILLYSVIQYDRNSTIAARTGALPRRMCQ